MLCIQEYHHPLPEHGEVHQFRQGNREDSEAVVQGDYKDEGTHFLRAHETGGGKERTQDQKRRQCKARRKMAAVGVCMDVCVMEAGSDGGADDTMVDLEDAKEEGGADATMEELQMG